ncbi:hypothetical protein OG762_06970 [Streptomyces sp. NBC_01136]|nr:hypothetical protein OG762_06970 [Streptomyces sp. NBC_01136]
MTGPVTDAAASSSAEEYFRRALMRALKAMPRSLDDDLLQATGLTRTTAC